WEGVTSGPDAQPGDADRLYAERIKLASWLEKQGNTERAERILVDTREELGSMVADRPREQPPRLLLARTLRVLAQLHHRRGGDALASAREAYQAAADLAERLYYLDPMRRGVADELVEAMTGLALVASDLGDAESALADMDRLERFAARLADEDPSNIDARRVRTAAIERRASFTRRAGNDDAADLGQEAVDRFIALRDLAPENASLMWDVPRARFVAGLAQESAGDRAAATASWEQAAIEFETIYTSNNLSPSAYPWMARCLRNAGGYTRSADPARALRWFLLADEIEPREESRLRWQRAMLARLAGENALACASLAEALAFAERDEDDREITRVMNMLEEYGCNDAPED
ncbi:MAG: hypothetical protein AAF235_10915, partial [Planctomycetota bacterium]